MTGGPFDNNTKVDNDLAWPWGDAQPQAAKIFYTAKRQTWHIRYGITKFLVWIYNCGQMEIQIIDY